MRLKPSIKITKFPLFQIVNRNFFGHKYEQRARFVKMFLAEQRKE